jgi:hypothetical protein
MCTLGDFSRAGYYRRLSSPPGHVQEDLKLRDAMHTIALDWPAYGSRRMKRELKKLGWKVNRKRVQRLMREDNLLCVWLSGSSWSPPIRRIHCRSTRIFRRPWR